MCTFSQITTNFFDPTFPAASICRSPSQTMQLLNELTERLAAKALATAADDLNALADLHSDLQALAALPEAAAMPPLRQSAGRLERVIEQIILRETRDVEAAVRTLTAGITELQSLTAGGAGAAPVEHAPAAADVAPAAADAHPAHPTDEQSLNADDLPLVQEFVGEARGHIESAEGSILRLEENPQDTEAINAIFRAFHTIKGVAGFLNLKQIGALAHTAENLLDLARQQKLQLTGATVDTVLAATDSMKGLVNNVATAAQTGRPIAADPALGALLDRLAACVTGKEPPAGDATPARPAAAQPATDTAPAAEAKPTSGAPAAEATVKVATDRLDSLINMVGELVIAQAMVAQDSKTLLQGNHRLGRNLGHLGKITRELQELSMSMRMVPIHGVFQKMSRLVRDLAKKTGKEINLSLVGGETELDRNLVEAITDPLVHMVRNAADHGVETPAVREQSGKPRAGTIELKAYHHSGNIVIEITDDGKGLNKARILKKAIAAGIVPEGQELSEAEIFKLIFHAGLSTAEKVTDVSGRGVGMDVVKKNVEALRGRIDITSVEGKGATFAIRLPLTLAVIDGLVVKVGAERFILPILSVEQSLRPKAEQLSSVQGRGEMCMVRHDLLPLYRLHKLLDLKPATEDPTESLVVIVQDDDRRCCLLVDELLGQQQVVIKSLGDGIGKVRGLSGGAILGDGNVSLILDVPGLIDVASGN
jgi:two-component system chemotaxis sensor kinase CheA